MAKPDYDTSIARMAGNIACGLVEKRPGDLSSETIRRLVAGYAVALAREIVAEIKRTEASKCQE